MRATERQSSIEVIVGYAADRKGNGISYARLRSSSGDRLLRVRFRVQRFAGVDEREIGYAAMTALASYLRDRGIARVMFSLNDSRLIEDVQLRRDVPPPITLPYIRLGCALNRFESYDLRLSQDGEDLTQRAAAELTLHHAA
jgi:hypothetical protein